MSVARYDKGSVRGEASMTEEGYIRATAVVTKTGVFRYRNPDGTVRRELRHPMDVLQEESLNTMKMIPVTNGHPIGRLVNADNSKELAVGYTGEIVEQDGEFILSKLVVTDKNSVEAVKEGRRKELSLGYTVDLVPEVGDYNGEAYDFRQTNIKYNHLSLVDLARAGGEARIALDSSDAIQIEKEESVMAKVKYKRRDGEKVEMELENKDAEAVEKLLSDMENLKEEKARVEKEMESVKLALEKSQGEKDAMEEKVKDMEAGESEEKEKAESEKMDGIINDRVKKRVKLEKIAGSVLPKEAVEKLDSLSDLDIKKEVVKIRSKLNLDDKSETYIDAAFDIAIQGVEKATVKASPKGHTQSNSDSEMPSADNARKRMIDRQMNPNKGAK